MIDNNIFNKIILFVATPAYGGLVNEKYVQGIVGLTAKCVQRDMGLAYYTRTNESLITRARNDLVFSFLQTSATHLMFIDADINFNSEDIFKMISYNKDIITGAYPTKTINWDNMSKLKSASVNELQDSSIIYSSSIKSDQKNEEGLCEVLYGATGFMLIKREVIEKMIDFYPETKYIPEIYDNPKDTGLPKYALFDTMIYKEKYLSEDYAFCHRWQKMGGKIYLDPSIILDHVGSYTFKGKSIF